MKKIFTLLLATITATSAFANSYSNDCCSSCGTNAYVDFLWWAAQGDQLDYGIVTSGDRVTSTDPDMETVTENWLEVEPNWNPGVRIGLEKDFACSNLQGYAEWTWYETDSNRTTNISLGTGENPVLTFTSDFVGNTGVSLSQFDDGVIRSKFHFQLNRLDIGLAHPVCLCHQLTLKPYAAFTYAHLNEDLRLHTDFSTTDENGFFEQGDYKAKTTYYGYGASLGLAANWEVFNCFSLFTEGSLTGLWGRYDINRNLTLNEGGTINDIIFDSTLKFDDWRGRLFSRIHLGGRYATSFCSCYSAYVQLGWEHQVLFNQTNWMVREGQVATVGSKPAADLILQGLVARVGFGF